MMIGNSENISSLCWKTDPIHRMFINNLIKIVLLISAILYIIVLVDDNIQMIHIKGILPFLIFTAFLVIFTERFHRKVAYKLNIIHESQTITLKMYRSEKEVVVNYDQIEQIRINGYLIFVVNGKRLFFGGRVDQKLVNEVKKIHTIRWGFLCYILDHSRKKFDLD